MDNKIINDMFEKVPHICAFCECFKDNHLIFWPCPLLENNLICQEDCQIEMLKEDVDVKVSAKLGKPVTKEFINETCKNCGMNNACQDKDLVAKIELGLLGGNNEDKQGPTKTR